MENFKTSQITDLRQSAQYAKYIRSIGWRVETVGRINIFVRPLGVFGAIAKIQRVKLPLPWGKISPVLKKHRVWMTKLEPVNVHPVPNGFHQDKWPLLATKTLKIDLTKSLQSIKQQFKKDARYCIRKSQVTNPKSQINNFDGFYELWKKATKIKKLWIPPKWQYDALIKSFGSQAFCLTIDNLAGAVVLMHDKTAYYYYAASLPEGKKRLLPYAVVWKSMQEAKKRGCDTWDFEGIFDPRWPNKSILGYSHFKKSFGGCEVEFPGSFTRWF